MASAALLHDDRDQAFAELQRARRITPEQTRYHPSVREALATTSQTDRCRTDSLAAWDPVGAYAEAQTEEREHAAASQHRLLAVSPVGDAVSSPFLRLIVSADFLNEGIVPPS
jgi:hypothetical protein